MRCGKVGQGHATWRLFHGHYGVAIGLQRLNKVYYIRAVLPINLVFGIKGSFVNLLCQFEGFVRQARIISLTHRIWRITRQVDFGGTQPFRCAQK